MMKWEIAIRPKLTAYLLLGSVLVLLACNNNISEKSRLQRQEKSFASIFEDRLMTENVLLPDFRSAERPAASFEYK